MSKLCVKCKNKKDCDQFSSSQWSSKFSRCKSCVSEDNAQYRKNNLQKIKEKDKQKSKKYYQKNKQKILSLEKEKYLNNKEKIQEKNKIYYVNNKEKVLLSSKKYYLNNKNKINNYYKNKRKVNVNFKIKTAISANISFYLKNNNLSKNKKSTLKYLNYSIEKLKNHLESLFEPWMNWNNYGKYDAKIWNNEELT